MTGKQSLKNWPTACTKKEYNFPGWSMKRLTFILLINFILSMVAFGKAPQVVGSGKLILPLTEKSFTIEAQPKNDFLYFVLTTDDKQVYDFTFSKQKLSESMTVMSFRIKRADEEGTLDQSIKRYCRKTLWPVNIPNPNSIENCWNPITKIQLVKRGDDFEVYYNDSKVLTANDPFSPILSYINVGESRDFSLSYPTNFVEVSPVEERISLLTAQHRFSLKPESNNKLGLGEKAFSDDKKRVFFITPDGGLYRAWKNYGELVETLDKSYYDQPHKLTPQRSLAGFTYDFRSLVK